MIRMDYMLGTFIALWLQIIKKVNSIDIHKYPTNNGI